MPFFPHVAGAEGAELLACKRGLVVAREAGVQRIILETDSVEVAAKLKGEG
jgi:ribonuclease HI